MSDTNESELHTTGDAGGAARVSTDDLAELKSEMQAVVGEEAADVLRRRRLGEDTLLCRWDGQSDDGRKHEEDLGERAMPFEGASDARIRMADRVVRAHRRLYLIALARMSFASSGDEAGVAARMEAVMRWVIRNRLSGVWRREWSRMVQWMLADSPSVGVMGVYWEKRLALVEKSLNLELLARAEAERQGVMPEDVAARVAEVLFRATEKDAAEWVGSLYEGVNPAHAVRLVRALRLDPETPVALPVPEVVENRPVVCAHRLYEDVFFPLNTTDLQRARVVFRREWLSETELREREHTMGYDGAWVEEVLKHEGKSGFTLTERATMGSAALVAGRAVNLRRGLYEVVTAYYRSANDDGVPAIYMVTLHANVDFAAKDREILPYAHGKYPFVAFPRETLGDLLVDSRGIPELAMTDQRALKQLHDMVNDHAQLSTVPPVKVSANRPDFKLTFEPLGKVREYRPDEVKWMSPPAYPATNDSQRRDIEKRTAEYFALPAEGVSPEDVAEERQVLVDDFLEGAGEVLMQMAQLVQQYMPDEDVERVTGEDGAPVARTTEDIRGRYNLEVAFDARTLNLAWLKETGDMWLRFVVSIDKEGVVDTSGWARAFAGQINPWFAKFVKPAESAARAEADDEDANFAKIAAGVEPPMLTKGQNFGLRLKRLQDILTKNPESLERLGPTERAILDARLKHLEGQVAQEGNARIGRLMAKPALG